MLNLLLEGNPDIALGCTVVPSQKAVERRSMFFLKNILETMKGIFIPCELSQESLVEQTEQMEIAKVPIILRH